MTHRRHRVGQRSQHYRAELYSSNPDTLPWRPLPRPMHKGITRSPRAKTAPDRPVTEAQAEVLRLLSAEPQSPRMLGRVLERSPAGVVSSLYQLGERGLAIRVPGKGWKLAED